MMPTMATRDVLWAAWDGQGFEHLRLQMDARAVRADSLIIAVDDGGRPYRGRYRLESDGGWTTQRVLIERLSEPAGVLDLRVDGHGRWSDAATGAALPLDGCVDVDIFPSPFTRSEERRVGKESRCRWSAGHVKLKTRKYYIEIG